MNDAESLQSLSHEAREALMQAGEWRLISLLLERPHGNWRHEVDSVAAEVRDPALRRAAALAQAATEESYLAFLGPGAPVSPREAGYAGLEDLGRLLADIQAFYTAFSYAPQAEDPSDHVAVEVGFAGYLALKEAYALVSENEDAAQITHDAQQRFLEEHLARLARGLQEKFGGSGPAYLVKTLDALSRRMTHVPVASIEAAPVVDPLAAGCPMAGETVEEDVWP